MKTTRRQFIKISGLGAGSLALATPTFNLLSGKQKPQDDIKSKRYPNYCEICFWNCAGWVYTNEEGKIWKIIGHDDDPNSNGRFCPRGTGGVGSYYDDDRLKTPLIRYTKEDGSQDYREATWDEALDLIATKVSEIKNKYGAESIALFNHGSAGKHFTHLFRAMGSSNIAAPANAQCKTPRENAFKLTFGHELHSPEPLDIQNADCMVLIGSHLGENMHNGQVQEMSMLIERGGTIITVDPRYSVVASKSKIWLPIKPSTDIALLLAWINVIINENRYDKEYIEKHAHGFNELKEYIQPFTPEWASLITTLDPTQIVLAAREMAAAAPAVIVHPGRHVTWYGDDTQRLRAVAILNALLGSWGRKGGFFFSSSASVGKHPAYKVPYPKPKWSWMDIRPGDFPLANTGITNVLVDGSHPDYTGENIIKAWFVVGSNLPVSIPNKQRTLEAMDNMEFIVVVDTMPMEITSYADVVLPEATYLERYDILRLAENRYPTVALRMPAAEPRWESKPGWWMAKQLGDRMGLNQYFAFESYEEVLEAELSKLGVTLEQMKEIGVLKLERPYDDAYMHEGDEIEFETPTGKIELLSTELAALGFDPFPKYTAHAEPPAGYYYLNYGRVPMHTFSRTSNNPNLSDLKKEHDVWINPIVANDWGIKNGQYIWLQNQAGVISDFPVKVRVTERIRWDSVFLPHGFGHNNPKLSRAHGKGVSDTQLISNVMHDPINGSTGMRLNFVTFLTEDPRKETEA
jgi:thiosulfate reductase/polysulfide reductase chain A